MNILALDLGKYKTVFCNYNPTNGEHEFGKVRTTPQEIHDLIVEKEPQKIVLEVCHIAGWIVDIAKALGIETKVADTRIFSPLLQGNAVWRRGYFVQ